MTTVNEAKAALRSKRHFSIKKRREFVQVIANAITITPGSDIDKAYKALKASKRYSVTLERKFLEVIAGGSTVTPLRSIAVQNRVLSTVEGITGKTVQLDRVAYILGTDASTMTLAFNNWIISAAAEENGTSDYTILDCSIESPGGVVVPVYFSGVRSKLISIGDTNIQSDPVLPSAFGLTQFSRTEQYWVKARLQVPVAGNEIPYGAVSTGHVANQQAVWIDPAVTTIVNGTDVAGVYTYTGGTPTARSNGNRPIMLGNPLVDGNSYIAVGDSITEGTGDNTSNLAYGIGWFQWGMHQADNSLPIPSINFARSGTTSTSFTGGTKWRPYIAYCKNAAEFLGTNDIGTGGAINAATMQTRKQAVWTILKAGGIQKIVCGKFLPRVTSTDSYATLVNQTPVSASWDTAGAAKQVNDWLDTKVSDATINATIPFVSARDGSDIYRWPVTGAANYATTDGTHPSHTIHLGMGAEFRTIVAALG